MYTVTAKFITIPKKRREFHQTLGLIVKLLYKAAGCAGARYEMDPLDKNKFRLTIDWDQFESWDRYQQTDEYKALMGMKNLLTSDYQVAVRDVGGRPSAI